MANPGTQEGLDPGVRKAAIAVLALGSDIAKDIFSILDPEEIQQILQASEEIRDVEYKTSLTEEKVDLQINYIDEIKV